MRLQFTCTRGCRMPAGTGAPLAAVARELAPRSAEVQVVVGRDPLLRRLNRTFRGKDRPTDVLSFAYDEGNGDSPAGGPAGEVFVSLDRAAAQARAAGHAPRQEFVLLVLHGLLHLQGHDHHTAPEARRMRTAETRALRRLARRHPELVARPMLPAPRTTAETG